MSAEPGPIDTTIHIVTPENIAFQYRVAGPFRRLPAFFIDLLVRLAVLFVLNIVLGLANLVFAGLATAVLIVAFFLLEWFYGGFFEAYWNGQTPGKRLMGIRVLTTSGQPINGLQAVLRNVLRVADMMPPIATALLAAPAVMPTCLLGLIVMMMNKRFQRLGDIVCNTMVVIEERHWLAGMAKIDDPRAYQLAGYLPADLQVSRSLARAIAHYVERRKYFSVPRRREVAQHLGVPLLRQFGLPPDTSHDLLLCSMYYRLFIADRGQDEKHVAAAGQAAPLAPVPPGFGGGT